jgi:hypothetical protein
MLALMPVGVLVDEDSSETNLEFMASSGQYAFVARGCDNEVLHKEALPLQELSAVMDYKTKSPVRVGAIASYLNTKIEDDGYTGSDYKFDPVGGLALNPFMNLEFDYFAIGGGAIWADNSMPYAGNVSSMWFPSGYIRFGNPQNVYFDMSLFHNAPLISGNNFNMGIGSRQNPDFEWWLGAGFLPYEHLGVTGKAYIPIHGPTTVSLFARFGATEGVTDAAIGIGLRYRY